MWLALVTHPLLDAMTVYGTQLALPFSDHPFGVGSIFIIDPLYTLPLLAGTGWVLAAGNHVGDAPAWHQRLLTGVAALVVWRTRIHLLWLLGAGAVLGAIGFV